MAKTYWITNIYEHSKLFKEKDLIEQKYISPTKMSLKNLLLEVNTDMNYTFQELYFINNWSVEFLKYDINDKLLEKIVKEVNKENFLKYLELEDITFYTIHYFLNFKTKKKELFQTINYEEIDIPYFKNLKELINSSYYPKFDIKKIKKTRAKYLSFEVVENTFSSGKLSKKKIQNPNIEILI
jgi:hypothetical protein